MFKFPKNIIIVLISLIILFSLYCQRTLIFVPFIQKYIHTKTGYNIKFGNFYILPFSLTLTDLNVNNVVAMRKVTFKLNPIKFFAHITSPTNCISRINISKLEVSLNQNHKDKSISPKNKNIAFKLPKSKVVMFIDEAIIKNSTELLKVIDSHILINPDKIILESIIYTSDTLIKLNSYIERTTDNVLNSSSVFTANDKMDMLVNSIGTIDLSSLNITQNITVEKFIYKGFNLNGSSGIFSRTENSCKMNLIGQFGEFAFNSSSNGVSEVKSEIDISKLNKKMVGDIKLNFKGENNTGVLELNMTNLVVFGFNCGNFTFSGTKNRDKFYNMSCIYGPGKKIETNFAKDGNYEVKLIAKNETVGTVKGNLKVGEITAYIKNVNIRDLPIIPSIGKDANGIVNISGTIDDISGQINFALKNFHKSGTKNTNMMGTITRNNDMYVFNFYKDDNSIALNNVIKSGKIISTDFKFVAVDISNVLDACGYSKHNITGVASGRVKYEKDAVTEFDIKAFNGTFYNNKFKKIEAKGDINLNRINVERFVLNNDSNEIIADVTGILGFTESNSVSSFSVNLSNMNAGGINLSGYAAFQGHLEDYNKIKGIIKSTGVVVSGVSIGNISANATISTEKFEISNLKSDNGIEATVVANFKTNELVGNIYFKNTSIKGIYPGVSGIMNSEISSYGKLSDPDINITASIRQGKYLSLPFAFSSELEYKNKTLKITKAALSVDKTKIALNGNYLNDRRLSLTVENLTGKLINTLIGFKTPIVEGSFSGSGIIAAKGGKQYLKMFLNAKNAYIKTVKLNDIKSNIEIRDGNIEISGASAKILNSEIKVDEGFFNIKGGEYGLNLFLVNAHIGPIDLFGNIKLSGKMTKIKGSSIYNGTVNLQNLWINRYKLSSSYFDYAIKDKTLEFLQKADDENLYNSSGLIIFNNTISVKEFNVLKDKTSFNLKADFSKDYINLGVKSSNIDWDFITDVLNLPKVLKGDTDINISLSGNTNSPKGNISVTSIGGSVIEVPYDNFDIEIDLSDNRARIKKASVFKRNEITISILGSFPLCFDKTLSTKMKKESIDIFYEIEDRKLNVLKYLAGDYIKPYSGKMFLKGSCTGTYAKINNNGRLSITGGSLELKNYINKVKDMSVEISLIENLIKIDRFNLKSGSGKLNVYGQLRLNNFNIRDFDVRLITDKKGIFLRIPQLPISSFLGSNFLPLLKDYSTGEPCFNIKVHGTPTQPKVSGWILLENTRFTFPGNIGKGDTGSFIPKNTEIDLELRSAKNTRFENSFASALVNGSIYIKGYYNNLKINGIIETSKGKINYLGREFDIVNALIEIMEGNQIYITAEAETTVPLATSHSSEKIKLVVDRAKILNLSVRVFSKDNPNMGTQKALEKAIMTDTDIDPVAPTVASKLEDISNSIMRQQSLRVLNQTLTMLTRMILPKTGVIDNLKVSYVQTNISDNEENFTLGNWLLGTKYSLEKNLTNQILLGYSLTFDDSNRGNNKLDLHLCQAIEMEYKLAKNLFLSGSYEIGAENLNYQPNRKIMLKKQIRFGRPSKKK